MYARSRGVLAPTALARSTAAHPSVSPRATGGPARGLPHQVMALPQYAMPHMASIFATSSKAAPRAIWNQNECSMATARSNAGWAAAEQEVSKCTVPSFSPSWAGTGEAVRRRTPRSDAERESLRAMKRRLGAGFAAQSSRTLLF